MAARAAQVITARAVALRVVQRVFEQGAYADRTLAAEAAGLDPRDRALATRIAYGTVQRRATLDHAAQKLVRRPLAQLEPVVLASLRVGLFQLLYMERVPSHAVVDETVELAKRSSRGGAGLVNAVLRRAAREDGALLGDLADDTPAGAALMHSVPEWLAELWWDEMGAEEARALLRKINEPAEAALRVNTLTASVAEVVDALPVPAAPAAPPRGFELPEGIVLGGPFDAHGSELWARGAVTAQSRASMLVSRILEPSPEGHVLDLCAAPGGKTTHLAALIQDRGRIVAVERNPARARALEENCRRMRVDCVKVRVGDAADYVLADGEPAFDCVLVDPPCSGLGTLQSRPDRRWRASPEAVSELAALQARILAAGAAATRPGGALVYSVCTISSREGPGVVDAFLRANPVWEVEETLQLLPHLDATDGFLIARMRRGPR